jgi:hypothetical protein
MVSSVSDFYLYLNRHLRLDCSERTVSFSLYYSFRFGDSSCFAVTFSVRHCHAPGSAYISVLKLLGLLNKLVGELRMLGLLNKLVGEIRMLGLLRMLELLIMLGLLR